MSKAGPTPQWIYQFLPGSRPELATEPDAWTESDEGVAGAHFAYLQGALANQTLVMAGRSQDGIGPAIVIFEASDEDAARAFMEADPFISSGLSERGCTRTGSPWHALQSEDDQTIRLRQRQAGV